MAWFSSFFRNKWKEAQRALQASRQIDQQEFLARAVLRPGVDRLLAETVLEVLQGFSFAKDFVPAPEDSLHSLYGIDGDAIEDIFEELFERLELPPPSTSAPLRIPQLETVGDLLDAAARARQSAGKRAD